MEKSPPRSYKKQQKNLNELTNQELKKIVFNTKNFK